MWNIFYTDSILISPAESWLLERRLSAGLTERRRCVGLDDLSRLSDRRRWRLGERERLGERRRGLGERRRGLGDLLGLRERLSLRPRLGGLRERLGERERERGERDLRLLEEDALPPPFSAFSLRCTHILDMSTISIHHCTYGQSRALWPVWPHSLHKHTH